MALLLDAACLCNTGKVRTNNEDNFFFDGQCLPAENDGLPQPLTLQKRLWRETIVAVFDGMGGENYGELASFAAANCMKTSRKRLLDFIIPKEQSMANLYLHLNEAVVKKAKELSTERMGSTMVALCFSGRDVYISNLGDSRAYLYRDNFFSQISKDHVEKREGKKKSPLTQHLGIDPELFLIEPHIVREQLRKGDQYLICSDGLTDMLTNREIIYILEKTTSAEDCVQNMVEAALAKGGKDNITVVVCKLEKK